ncbi:hypothetical protein PSTT_13673 [Puccinia striiformis]|uniref:Uncharacterized protein n=2 Tax=Puccinia striiformis TaxID=27350 RepID=A0A2S4UQU2_9BASI|nr:hypothetical protein PSTT_13673 [Puccinia striiformis]
MAPLIQEGYTGSRSESSPKRRTKKLGSSCVAASKGLIRYWALGSGIAGPSSKARQMLFDMPPFKKGKLPKEVDSDSDESFHCKGRPWELVEAYEADMKTSQPISNSINVPDDQEYFLYSAGLARLNPHDHSRKPQSHPYNLGFKRASTVYSSDSECTRVGRPLIPLSEFAPMCLPDSPKLKSTKPPKSKLKWNIRIPRPSGFSRMALSPTSETDSAQALDLATLQAPSLRSPPSSLSSRRQGMVFNIDDLPAELKEFSSTQEPSGSRTRRYLTIGLCTWK